MSFKFKLGNINLKIRERKKLLKKLLKWFLRCQSINVIIEETKIKKHKVLKALEIIRKVIAKNVP